MYVLALRPKKSTKMPLLPAFWSAMKPTVPPRSSTSVTLGGRAFLGDDPLALPLAHAQEPVVDVGVVQRPGDAGGFEAERRQHVAEDFPVAVMAGEHDQPLVPLEQQAQDLLEIVEPHITRPGVQADQPRGEEHFDAEHEQLLHAPAGEAFALGSAGSAESCGEGCPGHDRGACGRRRTTSPRETEPSAGWSQPGSSASPCGPVGGPGTAGGR